MSALHIRHAVPGDAPALGALIRGLAHHFTLHPDGRGAERFLATVSPAALAGCIGDPAFDYRVGEVGGRLAGAVALRDGSHLYHLFVAAPYQGCGYARALWETVRRAAPEPGAAFTVNAAANALPIYAHFGFRASGPRVATDGIAFLPMRRPPAPG